MEHGESSVDNISNALQSGQFTSLAAILKVCRDGGLHKNNEEEPLKGAYNGPPNQKQVLAHQKAHKSDQYLEEHPLARIRRRRKGTYGHKYLADVISTCRSKGRQAFNDVANVPASDLVKIDELQREMGVEIANPKIHVSDTKHRRRQSKLSLSSSGTIVTGTRSVSEVSASGATSRDSSLPSTTKSSCQRTPIIQPEGEISSEDWLQIRMHKRSKRYRQSEPELLKGNGSLDCDPTSTGDSTTTDTMDKNLVTHLVDSDTVNDDTSGDGISLADPQFAEEKKDDGTEVTKMTDENTRSNEQNHNNNDDTPVKENVIAEVKMQDGNLTLVLYKVKEESFLKMKHEYHDNEKVNNNGKLSDYLQEKKADVEMKNVSSETVNENSYSSTKVENKTVNESKRDLMARNKAHKSNDNHGEGCQENNNPQNHAGKIQEYKQKVNIILNGKTVKKTREKIYSSEPIHKNEPEVANKNTAIASDSDNNNTANSFETTRQNVDSGIVLANNLEDKRSTVKHETNRGRVLKFRHSSGDLTRREQPSSLSTNRPLSELKSKPRQVNPGIDVASKIVDSRKQFYQNGTVHSPEIREHRILNLFREIQRVRNVTVFPGSYDVIEDATSSFLMIDYDKQHRIGTFSDCEAIGRFFVQTNPKRNVL